MPSQPMELIFPLKGLDEGWAFGRQPKGTTPDVQNCYPFDPLDSRARGGQRPGLSKYYADQHNGSEPIQHIISLPEAVIGTQTTTEAFTQANGVLSDTNWYPCEWQSPSSWIVSATYPRVESNAIMLPAPAVFGATTNREAGIHKTAVVTRPHYVMTADVTYTLDVANAQAYIGFITRSATAFPAHNYTNMVLSYVQFWRDGAGTGYELTSYIDGVWRGSALTMTPGSGDYLDPAWYATARTFKLVVDGNVIKLYIENTLIQTEDIGDRLLTQTGVGFYLGRYSNYTTTSTLDNWTMTNIAESSRDYKLVVTSGGDVFSGRPSEVLTVATGGTNALNTSGKVRGQPAFSAIYFTDGDPAHYKLWTSSTDAVTTWTPTAGTLPMGSNQTAVSITGVNQGTPSFTVAENWSTRAAGDYLLVAGSTGNDGYYTIASVAGSGPTTITVNEAIPDATVDGTIQYQDEACRIICLYRGRIVMAGLVTDPQNWFMSTAGEPLDWDYGQTATAIMPVAGNNTNLGEMADIITCLAPYSDDLMYMGGDHTLWLMRGDPAAGGEIDNVSYQTGIVGPEAYAFDPDGVFYFFGAGTVWRLTVNGVPEPISRSRLDKTFKDIDLVNNTVKLVWDNLRHGLLILIIPREEGSTTHYFWDRRTDSFWKFVYPDACGPTTAHAFEGDNPADNAVLMGSWNGYIYRVDSDASNDAGTAVNSYVYYPIIALGHPLRRTRINRFTVILDTDSNDVDLTVYAEDTVQKAIESSTIRVARTLSGGRNVVLSRIAGDAIAVKLSNATISETWAIEDLVVHGEVTGRVGKNQL